MVKLVSEVSFFPRFYVFLFIVHSHIIVLLMSDMKVLLLLFITFPLHALLPLGSIPP